MRKLYENRTFHVIQDFNDQPEGRYCVFVHDLFGDRVIINCDRVDITPSAIILKRDSEKLNETAGIMVGVIPVESVWGVIAKDRVIHMTGREWEQYKIDEAENQAALFKEQYGSDKLISVIMLPDGRQLRLPVTDEQKAAVKAAEAAEVKKEPEVSNGQYGVARTHI